VIVPLTVRLLPLAAGTLIAITLWFVPRLTRADLYFAVTVAPGFRDSSDGILILRRYRRELFGVSTVALGLLAGLALTPALPLAPLGLLVQLGAYYCVFFRARRLVLTHAVPPTTVREAQITARNRRIFGGWLAASGPFCLLAVCAGYLWLHWGQIPTQLVVHWNAQGKPDRWAVRNLGSVFFPLLTTATILAALTLLLYGIAHWLRPIYTGGIQGARESRFRRTVSALLLATEYLLALQSSWIAIQPLLPGSNQRPAGGVALLLPLLVVIGFVVSLMRLGQGGSRMSASQTSESAPIGPVGDRTEDRFWKLGIFYFNRSDPAVLVEKRFGIGYTMNFGHPVAWAILLLIVLAPIVIARLSHG
jgi:uncharacterized membrane protein